MASTIGQEADTGRKKRRMFPVVDARFQWKYTMMITAIGASVAMMMGAFLYRVLLFNIDLPSLSVFALSLVAGKVHT